jgi:hypothetical protein
MPYQASSSVGADAAAYILNLGKTAVFRANQAGFLANMSDELMTAALDLEISDRITVTESVTGISMDYFINSVNFDVSPGGLIRCTWALFPADIQKYWRLEVDGFTELGQTTVLSYGLFAPLWQLNVSTLGVDTVVNAA